MSTKPPEYVEVDQKEFEEILNTVKGHLTTSQYKILTSAIKMLTWLQFVIKEKDISISRLARMLFGKKTESLKYLKKSTNPKAGDKKSSNSPKEDLKKDTIPNSPKNHGRRPLNSYNVSKIVYIPHTCYKAGQKCPACLKGKLYDIDPATVLSIRGGPPLIGEAYSAQGLRCSLCQKVFRATFPEEIARQPKAALSAKAIVCLAKYQLGTPLYRMETWQKTMNLPISDAEMWEWTESVAVILQPVHQALFTLAAKGEIIHHDDTFGRVLELMIENEAVEEAKKNATKSERRELDKHRKGIYTTALLSKIGTHQIAIYLTGRNNSGENLDNLLDLRPKSKGKPIQACDASSNNTSERHDTKIAKCFNHARHNFCELVEEWPNEALNIVQMCNEVFFNDWKTKVLDPIARLKFHKEYSAPILKELKSYANSLISNKIVEPNSSFGKAINYLNKHWSGLTLILRDGQAPLSNNDCERSLKSKVLIRKNSYFYKTCWGAFVGDTILSIIKTCSLNQVNPYNYLVAIQANAEHVKKSPEKWMPWNYTQNSAMFLQQFPQEEIYKAANSPISGHPHPNGNKKNLRERAREFFKSLSGKARESPVYS